MHLRPLPFTELQGLLGRSADIHYYTRRPVRQSARRKLLYKAAAAKESTLQHTDDMVEQLLAVGLFDPKKAKLEDLM